MARTFWVNVKPRARREAVVRRAQDEFLVTIHAPPADGEANRRLIELLAEFFHTAKSNIRILRGQKSRRKLIQVD